ncbi:MAG: OmpA family protein [Gammaproteobacteria bacterium]|jgi:peptidoglycan-associated lipoprotein|nr:OmpA family protein [Pseudomonadota bacterium]|tara:strand:- start:381 stop:881 length:501 start_codon:yes stop_codon:yes gene_type:complete
MKKINILIFTLVFMFSCSTVPVEEVDSQQATTVDLTSDSDTSSEAASDPMSDVDIGEPYVKIYFDYDQDTLREDALSDLLKVSRLMKDNPKYTLLVEGHADERGTREYNLALSERRAKAVEDFLSASGVSSFNVEVVGYGEEKPVDNGSNESAWSQNRRAELFFIK